MYHTIQDFLADWREEVAPTTKILVALTDASLDQPVYAGGRKLGQIAWHLAETIEEMGNRAGLSITGAPENTPAPAKANDILIAYTSVAQQAEEQITRLWNDAHLTDMLEMYGETWSRARTLSVLVRHQAHHRGQMTVLMRQAGLPVPGVYGPSKDEWIAWNIPPRE
jgi:uncharacterized damage-inducible protein DinB